MQRSSEQPLVGEERYVTTLITAAKETISLLALTCSVSCFLFFMLNVILECTRNDIFIDDYNTRNRSVQSWVS